MSYEEVRIEILCDQIEKEYKNRDWSLCAAQYAKGGQPWPCIQKMGHDGAHVDCNGNEF